VSFSGTSSVSIFKPAVLRYVRAAASTYALSAPFVANACWSPEIFAAGIAKNTKHRGCDAFVVSGRLGATGASRLQLLCDLCVKK
jgi:hypothetical protein